MKIITSGLSYLDIDAYACSIAYAELLNLQGDEAVAVSTAALNESIPKVVRSWEAPLLSIYDPMDEDEYIIVDVSEPQFLDKIVDVDKVVEVIDHHVGYEDFWQQRIGDKADIEFVGAACTQIYERWMRAGLFEKMSQLSARLLVCGILDNKVYKGKKVVIEVIHSDSKPIDAVWFNPRTGYRSNTIQKSSVSGTIQEVALDKNVLVLKPKMLPRMINKEFQAYFVYIIDPQTAQPMVKIRLT